MISSGSLAAFSTSAIGPVPQPAVLPGIVLPAKATVTPSQSGVTNPVATAPSVLPFQLPARTTPRGSLLDLSV